MVFWLALAVPGALMLRDWQNGAVLAMDLVEPSGLMAVRLMVLALLPGPLAAAFGVKKWLRGWIGLRRNLGVASFAYAVLHLAFYALDLGALAAMVEEIGLPGIWTGWLALLLLAGPAATSSQRAMFALARRWKPVQRLAYGAVLLSFAHWLLLEWNWPTAAIHLLPLIIAWTLRFARRRPKLQGT
jgi:sulfoxide reductase heme-binding subunit YedZ